MRKFEGITGNRYKINGGEEYGTLETVNECRNYALGRNLSKLKETMRI